jgi:hypothetical protein
MASGFLYLVSTPFYSLLKAKQTKTKPSFFSILWIAVFGVFAKLFIHENPEGDSGIQKMKNAVWVDLVNAILWLLSAAHNFLIWLTHRGGRSLHTGRAAV